MNVLYAVLCEGADSRPDGRVDIHGVFHHLYAPGFPAQQDHMVLLLAVEWEGKEAGRQTFRIDLVDPSGSPVATISGHTDVTRHEKGKELPQTRVLMPLENVVFPTAGTYGFVLQVGDTRTRLCPLHLLENPDAR